MQIEIPAQKLLDKLGARVGQLTTEVVHLQVTNEALTERLQEVYQEVDRLREARRVGDDGSRLTPASPPPQDTVEP